MKLADRLSCSVEERSEVYYVALLIHVGCTAVAPYFASWVGGDEIHFQRGASVTGPASEPREDMRYLVRRFADDRPLPERARRVAKMLVTGQKQFEHAAANLCEGGRLLARRLHLPDEVERALGQVTERWDGKGGAGELAGGEISRPLRIVRVVHDFVRSPRRAIARRRSRRSRGVAIMAMTRRSSMLHSRARGAAAGGGRSRRVGADPRRRAAAGRDDLTAGVGVGRAGLRRVHRYQGRLPARAFCSRGRARRGGERGARLPAWFRSSAARASSTTSAGSRCRTGSGQRGPLTVGEQERVRLHPYYTERVLERSGARAAGPARQLPSRATRRLRLPPRNHGRPAERRRAAGAVALNVRQGHPAGLSDREVEVLRLIAQGRTSRQIAEALVITEKTAGHHVEHVYAKVGVSTRVGAALFAMQHNLAD